MQGFTQGIQLPRLTSNLNYIQHSVCNYNNMSLNSSLTKSLALYLALMDAQGQNVAG